MCGIVGGVTERNVAPILVEGLKKLEYRGYDSAGLAILGSDEKLHRLRAVGKVKELDLRLKQASMDGAIGIAHTRWATHGKPTENNAHPHTSNDSVAIVHNGIIENYKALRDEHIAAGYEYSSETDTEVIAHAIYQNLKEGCSLLQAIQKTIQVLEGAFAIAVISSKFPDEMIVARKGSPLVIGIGIGEHFVASDFLALLPVTQQFIYLEEGDTARLTKSSVEIFDVNGGAVSREVQELTMTHEAADRGEFRHFMLKEIFEQPVAVSNTLEGRISEQHVLEHAFGVTASDVFKRVEHIHIIACGTSYHAGCVARYWFEELTGLPCQVEIASEYRYRNPTVLENTLFVTLSQSGETADTLAALRVAKERGYLSTLAICNVPASSLVREAELVLMTHAGPEIGVASTKAFTSQLIALLLLVAALGRQKQLPADMEHRLVSALRSLPKHIDATLELSKQIKQLSTHLVDSTSALFLGRGSQYPIAMEGALKLKEISYIHAEAYPAGELKHGPLALVDKTMPVVVVVPNNALLDKIKSNLQEVQARGGQLIIFADHQVAKDFGDDATVIGMPQVDDWIAPIVYTIPLQLLAYFVAVKKGTDVDQPRNLAKSVTVE